MDGVPEDTYSDMWSTVMSDDIKSTANHSKLFRVGQCAETCRWLRFNKITFIHSSALVGTYAPNMQHTSLSVLQDTRVNAVQENSIYS